MDDLTFVYSIIAIILSAIFFRLVFSVGKSILYQKIIVRLLMGIAKKMEVDEKYFPAKNETTIDFPNEKKS